MESALYRSCSVLIVHTFCKLSYIDQVSYLGEISVEGDLNETAPLAQVENKPNCLYNKYNPF